jgi:hypothetical protein
VEAYADGKLRWELFVWKSIAGLGLSSIEAPTPEVLLETLSMRLHSKAPRGPMTVGEVGL